MAADQLYSTGTRIPTPLGIGTVRSYRNSRHQHGVRLIEVQLAHESCIRTWTEAELALSGGMPPPPRPAPTQLLRRHYVPGEAVSTLDGEAIVRNLLRDATGAYHALVQLVGTNRTVTVPCADLSPPLEAA